MDMDVDVVAVAHQDLAGRLRTLLHEDVTAGQTYRQLQRDVADPTARIAFELLVRETEERCVVLQHMIDGTLDGASPGPSRDLAGDVGRLRAAVMDIQALAHTARRHAEQLRDMACTERGSGHPALGALLDTLARDSDKHASLSLELARHLWTSEHVAA
jgi:hypothetical protein